MSDRRLLGTNVVLRHVLQNHELASTATRLFAASDRGEVVLILLPAVLAECVFVLESFYQHTRIEISGVLTELIRSSGIELSDSETHQDALRRYANSKLHFVDCVLAAYGVDQGIAVATFDAGIRKFRDLKVNVSVKGA